MSRLQELVQELDWAELRAQDEHRAIIARMALQRFLMGYDEFDCPEDPLLDGRIHFWA